MAFKTSVRNILSTFYDFMGEDMPEPKPIGETDDVRASLARIPDSFLIEYAVEKELLAPTAPPPANIVDFLAQRDLPDIAAAVLPVSRLEVDYRARQITSKAAEDTKATLDQTMSRIEHIKWVFSVVLGALGILTAVLTITGFRVETRLQDSEKLFSNLRAEQNLIRSHTVADILEEYETEFDEFTLNSLQGPEAEILKRHQDLLERLSSQVKGSDNEHARTLELLTLVNKGLLELAQSNLSRKDERPGHLQSALNVWTDLSNRELPRDSEFQSFFDRLKEFRRVLKACTQMKLYSVHSDPTVHPDPAEHKFLDPAEQELNHTDVPEILFVVHLYRGVVSSYRAKGVGKGVDPRSLFEQTRKHYDRALQYKSSLRQLQTLRNNYADSFMAETYWFRDSGKVEQAKKAREQAQSYLDQAFQLPNIPPVLFITRAELQSVSVSLDSAEVQTWNTDRRLAKLNMILQDVRDAIRLGFSDYKSRTSSDFLDKEPYFQPLRYLDSNFKEKLIDAARVSQ